MKVNTKPYTYSHLISLVVFITGLWLPYTTGLTTKRVNNSSEVLDYTEGYYLTTFQGYETNTGRFSIVLVVFISLIFFFTKKRWFKYLLIPIGILHILSQLLILLSTTAGFGMPFGHSLEIGFVVMFLGVLLLIITTGLKPTLNMFNETSDVLDTK